MHRASATARLVLKHPTHSSQFRLGACQHSLLSPSPFPSLFSIGRNQGQSHISTALACAVPLEGCACVSLSSSRPVGASGEQTTSGDPNITGTIGSSACSMFLRPSRCLHRVSAREVDRAHICMRMRMRLGPTPFLSLSLSSDAC